MKKSRKILIISDIHANLNALQAVLSEAGKVDETWCLGDTVGYGPDPNECIELIRNIPNLICMMGNHDLASSADLSLDAFNVDARNSLLWQRSVLKEENQKFLCSLPQQAVLIGNVTLAHGSPRNSIWEYILNTLIARLCLYAISTPWCLVGHSHFQVVFQHSKENDDLNIVVPEPGSTYKLQDRAIINPGSVGQPRDHISLAAYGLFYPENNIWEPRRAAYDIQAVQKRILKAKLPPRHAERLSGGW